MKGVNKVIIVGGLGADPEVKVLGSGNAVANLSVATSEKWKDKATGQQQEKTEWHRVVIFGKLAEIAGQYLRKGSKVYLEGKLQTRKWQDQQGVDKYTTEIVVDGFSGQMQMLGDAGGQGAQQPQQPQQNQGYQQQPQQQQQAPQPNYNRQASLSAPQHPANSVPQDMGDKFDSDVPF